MTPVTVTLTGPCPGCGAEATWLGESTPEGATVYRIDCDTCEPAVAA